MTSTTNEALRNTVARFSADGLSVSVFDWNHGSLLVRIESEWDASSAARSRTWDAGRILRAEMRAKHSPPWSMSKKMNIEWIFDGGFTARARGVRLTFVVKA